MALPDLHTYLQYAGVEPISTTIGDWQEDFQVTAAGWNTGDEVEPAQLASQGTCGATWELCSVTRLHRQVRLYISDPSYVFVGVQPSSSVQKPSGHKRWRVRQLEN